MGFAVGACFFFLETMGMQQNGILLTILLTTTNKRFSHFARMYLSMALAEKKRINCTGTSAGKHVRTVHHLL